MMGASGFLRTSPPAPPPPGTGVTSSPFDPLWGLAPPAFFSVDTNRTGLADEPPPSCRGADGIVSCASSYKPFSPLDSCNVGLL